MKYYETPKHLSFHLDPVAMAVAKYELGTPDGGILPGGPSEGMLKLQYELDKLKGLIPGWVTFEQWKNKKGYGGNQGSYNNPINSGIRPLKPLTPIEKLRNTIGDQPNPRQYPMDLLPIQQPPTNGPINPLLPRRLQRNINWDNLKPQSNLMYN